MKKSFISLFLLTLILSHFSILNLWGADYLIPVTPGTNCYNSSENVTEYNRRKIYIGNSGDWADLNVKCPSNATYIVYAGHLTPNSGNLHLYIKDANQGAHPLQAHDWNTVDETNCGSRGFTAGNNKISLCYDNAGYNATYIRLHDDNSQSTKTVPTSLDFYWDSKQESGDGAKVITSSDFMYDQLGEDYIKKATQGGVNYAIFNANTTASSRSLVCFPATGTYTFTFHVYASETNSDYQKPYVFVNSFMAGGGTFSLNDGSTTDIVIEMDVTAGTYPIAFYIPYSNHADRYHLSTVSIAQKVSCTAPNHVDISGNYHFFPGETISLTATAYSSAGTGSPIDDEDITGYQWQKNIAGVYTDIAGATSATYTKANATTSDVGQYKCIVSTGATCSTQSGVFDVKCLQLYLYYDNKSDKYNLPFTKVDDTHATASVLLDNGSYTYYYKITDGCNDWWGNNGTMNSGNCTGWNLDVNNHCGLTTTKSATYQFNLTYNATLNSFSMSVVYPSTVQTGGYNIYFDNSFTNWTTSKIYYRIGRNNYNSKAQMTLVPGTAHLYTTTTIHYENDGGFEAWHIANNGCRSEGTSIYKTNTGDTWAATQAMRFEGSPIPSSGITIVPVDEHWTGTGDASNCEFYSYGSSSGLLTHTATISDISNGSVRLNWTDIDDEAQSATATTAGLAHTCNLQVTAVPATGYETATLTVDGEDFTSGNTHVLSADATIAATFSLIDYNVTYSAPSNGSYTISVAGGAASGATKTANYNQTVSIVATPSDGYAFSSWTITKDGGGTVAPASNTASTSFTMPTDGVTITATFVETTCTNTYTIDCGSTADYVVPTSGTRVPSSVNNEAGIYNNHYTGYHGEGYYDFKGANYSEIYYAVHLPAAQYTFKVYTATNKDGQYINVYRRTDGESGDISYGGYYYTKMISQTNSYNNNNAFGVGRTISEQNLAEGDYIIGLYSNGAYAAYDQVVITANSDVFCRASTYDVTITGSPAAGQASATGAGSYEEGETVTINATPNRGYSFNTWSADPSVSFSSSASTASNSFSMPASDVALTASYNTLTSRTVTVNDDGNGSGSADLNPAYVGETVTLTATPNTGYRFVNWTTSDGVPFASSTSASTTFTMLDKNVTVQANFAEVNCVSSRTYQVEDIMITTADAVIHSADDDQADPTYVEVVNSTNNSNSNFHWSDYNGSADGGQYVVNLKSAGSNSNHNTVYMEVVIPATSSYDIQIRAGKGKEKNIWLNVFSTTSTGYKTVTYGGTTYYMVADEGKSVNSSNDSYAWQTTTWENISLPAGKLIIGVYAGYDNATLDWIKITRRDGIGSFCKHTITVNNTSGASSSAIADKSKALSGETVTVTAYDASDGYRFTGWTVTSGSATFADASALSTTFVMPDADVTVQANYASSGYTVTYEVVGEHGTISSVVDGSSNPVSSGGRVADGTLLTFTAAPAEGYAVLGWYTWLNSTETLQGNTQNNNTFTYTVTQDITIRVKFDTPYTLTLNSSPAAASATVSGGGSYVQGTVVSVSTSNENGDYTFVHWMDGESEVSTSAASNYVMPASNKTLTAVWRLSRISSLSWAGSEDLGSGIEVASSCFSGGCFDTQVTFTFSGNGTVSYYANNDRETPLGTITTSGTAITLNDDLRAHGIYIRCTSGAATLTAVSKTTIGSVYQIWSWERSSLGNVAVGDWSQQVVLGPEHFQTAAEGDVLRVNTASESSDAQGALQYILTDGDSHTYKGLDNSTSGGLRDWTLSNTEKDQHYFEITIDATHLANLKRYGAIVKGRNYTIQSVELRASCSNQAMRTTAPDVTIRGADGSIDIMDNKLEFADEGFNLGNWEHKVELHKNCFKSVEVGSLINFYMREQEGTTISFRCNVDSIHAESYKEDPPRCPSYGDISFDRTIHNLYGDEPQLIGQNKGYRVLSLLVDEDMLTRLKETGMILCGKGAFIKIVEGVPNPFVVKSGEEKEIPTVVNNLEIYQGGEAANEEDIQVLGNITYFRPAKGGYLNNKLNTWYTFTLPFEVSDVEVYDEAETQWYDINAVYYSNDETNQETNDPNGKGHYYLQYLSKQDIASDREAFITRWQYITPGHSDSVYAYESKRYGYPKKNEAYIILFDSVKPAELSGYWNSNPTIRFVGGPQTIAGRDSLRTVVSDGNQYWMYANNTLHSFTLDEAYILNEEGTYFILQSNPTIRPFECYVQATESLKTRYAALPMRGFHIDNTPTGAESIQGSAIRAEKILRNGQLIIIRNGVAYDATGVVIR